MAGEKVKGRKWHIVVDVMGKLLAVIVHAANIYDTKSVISTAKVAFEKYPIIQKLCGDDGYRKAFESDISEQRGLTVDISKRTKPEFEVIPKRWGMERTFAWLDGFCRLPKDYEIIASSEETNLITAIPCFI